MHHTRHPYALTIAGFDPSGGAGLLADIKTFESCRVSGICVQSALTVQNDVTFRKCNWESDELMADQLEVLLERFQPAAVKVGIIRSLATLELMLDMLPDDTAVVWDPVLSASAGFEFHQDLLLGWEQILQRVTVWTPNLEEFKALTGKENLFPLPTATYLKGGHDPLHPGLDQLLEKDSEELQQFKPDESLEVYPKHGSGCVFSAALTAQLAKKQSLVKACKAAKKYTAEYLASSAALIGQHGHFN